MEIGGQGEEKVEVILEEERHNLLQLLAKELARALVQIETRKLILILLKNGKQKLPIFLAFLRY